MYAVIEAGGKQYRVEVGTELEIDLVDAAPGDNLAIDRVLLVADGNTAAIGRPTVVSASVAAEVVGRQRGEKVISFKYRPKARRRVKKGHRQELTLIRISDIVLDGKSAAGEKAQADEARRTERQRLEEAARRQAEQDAALAARLAKDKAVATKRDTAAAAETTAPKGRKASGTAQKDTGVTKASTAKASTAKASTAKASTAKASTAKASKRAEATKQDDTSDGGTTAEKPAPKPRRARKGGADENAE